MPQFRRGSSVALACLIAAACGHKSAPPPAPPIAVPAGARLVISPAGAIVAPGGTQSFELIALDASGKHLDASHFDVEWVASEASAGAVAGSGATAQFAAGSSAASTVLVARSRSTPAIASNPVLVAVAKAKPAVVLLEDARIVWPPPRDPVVLAGADGLLPGISAPGADGHVTIGGFADADLLALMGARTGADGALTSATTAAVIRGAAPPVGTLLLAREGAPLAGKVLSATERGGFVLLQLQTVGPADVFDAALLSWNPSALRQQGVLQPQKPMQLHGGSSPGLFRSGAEAGGIECSQSASFDSGSVTASFSVDGTPQGEFFYDAHDGALHEVRIWAGYDGTAHAAITAGFQPGETAKFDCGFGPVGTLGPLIPPGPLGAFVTFKLKVRPFLSGKIELTAGPKVTLTPQITATDNLRFGARWSEGGGTEFVLPGPLTADLTMPDDGVKFDGTGEVPVRLSGNLFAGGRATVIASAGGSVVEVAKQVASYIPWFSTNVEKMIAFDIKLFESDAGPSFDAATLNAAEAVRANTDDSGLHVSAKITAKPWSTAVSGLNFIIGGLGVPFQFKPEYEASAQLYERPAPQRSKTTISITAGKNGSSDGKAPVLVSDGDEVSFQVSLAGARDELTEAYLYEHKDGAIEKQPIDFSVSGGTAKATWTVPKGFCGDDQSKTVQWHLVGVNRIFGSVPTGSDLATLTVSCAPIVFTANGAAITEQDPSWTAQVDQGLCPKVDLSVSAPPGGTGAELKLTSQLEQGGGKEDLGSSAGDPLQKTLGLKAGSYTWTATLESTQDGVKSSITRKRTLQVPECDAIRCGVGAPSPNGTVSSIAAGQCPGTVSAMCSSPYGAAMGGSVSGDVEGKQLAAGGSSEVSGSVQLDNGSHALTGTVQARTFGGAGSETLTANDTIEVKCDQCPNADVTDPCLCPNAPPSCGGPPGPGTKHGGQYGGPRPISITLGAGGGFGFLGTCWFGCGFPLAFADLGGGSWGDPHVTTYNGAVWTSLELGEFIYARSAQPGGLELQVRHQRLPGFQGWASFNTAAAVRAGGHVFEVRMPRSASDPAQIDLSAHRPLELLVDGQPATLHPQTYVIDAALGFRVADDGGLEVYFDDPTAPAEKRVSVARLGTATEQDLLRRGHDPQEPVVSISVQLLTAGSYQGILGSASGGGDKDLQTPGGTSASSTGANFMNAWRVIDTAQSLFTYLPGEGPRTFALRQTNALPTGAALAPWQAAVHDLFTATCGMTEQQYGSVPQDFIDSTALELAAGRSKRNLVASGICGDERLSNAAGGALVALQFGGAVTVAGRPDIPVAGARVQVIARELSRAVCDATTIQDGRWGCGMTDPAAAWALSLPVHFDVTLTGRGPAQTKTQALQPPAPGAPLSLTQDFAAPLDHALLLSGKVTTPQGLPAGHAHLRIQGPVQTDALAGDDGVYRAAIALPDGVLRGTLDVSVAAADGRSTATASVPFAASAPGVQALSADVKLRDIPGVLPPVESVRRLYFTGRLTNALAGPAGFGTQPLAAVRVSVSSDQFLAGDCAQALSDASGVYRCTAVLKDASPVRATLLLGPAGTLGTKIVQLAEVPGAGVLQPVINDFTLSPAALVISGKVDSRLGPIAGATVTLTASSGDKAQARTAADGSYTALLPLSTAGSSSGELLASATLGEGGATAVAATASQRYTVAASSLAQLRQDLHVVGGVAIVSGAVVNQLAANAPVPGARVAVSSSGQPLCGAVTDDSGVYGCAIAVSGTGVLPLHFEVAGRGKGSFDLFGGQPALLDESSVAPGAVTPILPSRQLAVSPSTLTVTGVVRDATGYAAAGALVGASADFAPSVQTTAGDDGSYSVTLQFEDGRASTAVTVSATAGNLATGASQGAALVEHGLAAIAVPLTLPGTLPRDGWARLAFSGRVENTLVPGTVVGGARVQVRFAGTAADLCDTVATPAGDYRCSALVPGAPASPAQFEYHLSFAGSEIAQPLVVAHAFVRSPAVESPIAQDLTGGPTTLHLHGRVSDGAGTAIGGAQLTLSGTAPGGAVTDAQGGYEMVVLTAATTARATGTLTAANEGIAVSAVLDAPLATLALTEVAQDLVTQVRHLGFAGSIENAAAPGSYLTDGQVQLLVDGQPICIASLQPAGSALPPRYACATDLAISSSAPLTVDWAATNAWGTATGSFAIASAQIPPAGQRKLFALPIALAATAVAVHGTVRDAAGAPLAGAAVAVVSGQSAVTATTAADGTYSAAVSLPDGLGQDGTSHLASLVVTASAAGNTARAALTATVQGGALNTATQDLAFGAQTNVSFAGRLTNINAAGQALAGAHVQVLRDGVDGAAALLCESDSTDSGWGCRVSLRGEALTAIALRYLVSFGGTLIAPPVVDTRAVTPGTDATNAVAQDLTSAPTTLDVRGRVLDPAGFAVAQVLVATSDSRYRALQPTAGDGAFELFVPLPLTATSAAVHLTGSLPSGATAAASANVAVAQPGSIVPVALDMLFSQRRLLLSGRVRNQYNAGAPLRAQAVRVEVGNGGSLDCGTTSAAAAPADNFSCPALLLDSDAALALTATITDTGSHGTATAQASLASADIPPAATSGSRSVTFDVAVPTLSLSGRITRDGQPLAGAAVALRLIDTTADGGATTSAVDGTWALLVSLTPGATAYDALLTVTDGTHSAQAELKGATGAVQPQPVTQNIDIVTAVPGSASWTLALPSSWPLVPAVGADGTVYALGINSLAAVSPATGQVLWSQALPGGSATAGPAIDASGAIYAGDRGDNVTAYGVDGKQLWSSRGQPGGSSFPGVSAIAVSRGVVYAAENRSSPSHLRAYRASDGGLLWSVDLPYAPQHVVVGADGSILVATSYGPLFAFEDTGTSARLRWTRSGSWTRPAVLPDDSIASVDQNSGALFDLDVNGAPLWSLNLRGVTTQSYPITPAAVDADGSIVLAVGTQLLRVSPSGQLLLVQNVVDAQREALDDTSPAIGAGGTIYLASRGTSGNSTAYALSGSDFTARWTAPSTTSDDQGSPVLTHGLLLVQSSSGLLALHAADPSLAASSWPASGHDLSQTSAAAPTSVQRRELLLSGHVYGAGFQPAMALSSFEVLVESAPGGPALCDALTDASGAYSCSMETSDLDAETLTITVKSQTRGAFEGDLPPPPQAQYTASQQVEIAASPAGQTQTLSADVSLPVTAARIAGRVTHAGQPLAGAAVKVIATSGTATNPSGVTTAADGSYVAYVLYAPDYAAADKLLVRASAAAGREVIVAKPALQPLATAQVALDFALDDRALLWSVAPASGPGPLPLVASPVTGSVYWAGYTNTSWGSRYLAFGGLSADGTQQLSPSNCPSGGCTVYQGGYSSYAPPPVVSADGSLVLLGGAQVAAFDATLKFQAMANVGQSGQQAGRPLQLTAKASGASVLTTLVPSSGTPAGRFAQYDLDFVRGTGQQAWALDLPTMPDQDALPVLGSQPLASGLPAAYLPLAATVASFDVATHAQRFIADSGLSTLPSMLSVWNDGARDVATLLVPAYGLAQFSGADGSMLPGWPLPPANAQSGQPLYSGVGLAAVPGATYYTAQAGRFAELYMLDSAGNLCSVFTAPTDESFVGGPVLDPAGGAVYVATTLSVFAVEPLAHDCRGAVPADPPEARALWRFSSPASLYPSLALGSTAVYVHASDGKVYAVQR